MNKRSLLRGAAAILATPLLPAAMSFAGETNRPSGVVELFTSQGCNSCPPADAVLADLTAKGDVITLGYHVDYWDYLGWKDTLSSPKNTARQYDYGKTFGIRSVYTPQAVINGRTHVNGAHGDEVSDALGKLSRSGEGMTIGITVTRSGDSVIIDTEGAPGGVGDAHLVLVYFDPIRPTVIQQGENQGRTIDYVNPVSDIQTAGMWHGKPARFEFPHSEIAKKGGCAVLLQVVSKEGLPGAILGATAIRPNAL
jgi:hypothetical protein